MTTPFEADGEIAPARLAAQVEIYADRAVEGFVVAGTSGEGPLLDEAEITELVRTVRGAGGGRPTIAQVGRESLRATLRTARAAAEVGADLLLALPPRYYPVDRNGVARWYHEIRAAVDRPLLAYHIPQRTGVEMTADQIAELAEEGALAGVKDSAGDLDLQRALRERVGEGFAIFNGRAATTAKALEGGADGAILAVADVAPEAVAALFAAHRRGELDAAREVQRSLAPLGEALGARFGVPAIKAALDLRGWPGGGDLRPPLAPLDAAARGVVAAALRHAGVEVG